MRSDWRVHLLRSVIHCVFLLGLIVLETSFFSLFPLKGVVPDLVLVGVISVGLLRGPASGMSFGLAGGLLADILTGRLIGLGALIVGTIGLAAGALGTRLYGERLIITVLFTVVGSFIHLALYGAGAWAFGVHVPIVEGMLLMAPWLMVYNGVMTLWVHPTVRRVYPLIDAGLNAARPPASTM